MVGTARCAVPVAEHSVRRRNRTQQKFTPRHARSALRFAAGGDIAARCPYHFKLLPAQSFFPDGSAGWDEYSDTSREMNTAIYNVPVIASVIASIRAIFETGTMSP